MQVAIVTGASSGIGRAIALGLASQGFEICLVARRRKALEAVAAEIHVKGYRGHVICADFTVDKDIHNLAQGIQRDFGRADALVSCGGAIFHNSLEQASLQEFDLQYQANLRGHYAVVQSLLPLLRKHRGQIVFINSSAGLRSPAGIGQYAATQHALRSLADTLREGLNPDGVRVLSVYPGRTATPRMAKLFATENQVYRPELLMQPEDVAAMVVHALCLPRTAEVTDIMMRPMVKSY